MEDKFNFKVGDYIRSEWEVIKILKVSKGIYFTGEVVQLDSGIYGVTISSINTKYIKSYPWEKCPMWSTPLGRVLNEG